MKMTIVRENDELVLLALDGSLDTQGVAQIDKEFHAHADSPCRSVIVDLSRVTFIMSRGITMLAQCIANLQKFDKKLVLLNPQPHVSEVLQNVALDRIMPVAKNLAEAEEIIKK